MTLREREVLQLLAEGHDPQAISKMMNLSIHTVREYIDRLRHRYGVHHVTGAVIEALRRGDVRCPCGRAA
jgi:DNA-binding CsgD family transcriptional regulator